jgi:hypothetical protein
MNNLLALCGPYIQNLRISIMVEKFVYTQSSFDESLEQTELSWQDLQGLSWLLCDDCSIPEKSNSFVYA